MKLESVLYLATAEIAVPTLEALHRATEFRVCGVCTQPDRPSGRNRRITPSPVKQMAMDLGLPVFTPEKVGTARGELACTGPDILLVFAYGQYIPASLCGTPAWGAINLHPSLLPRYRGASPIQSALLNGDEVSGLSVIRVGEKMDAGDILRQTPLTIHAEDSSETLHRRFAALAATEALAALRDLRDGRARWTPQDESRVLECRKFEKADGRINWALPAAELHNRCRAFQPWPGFFFPLETDSAVKVLRTRVDSGSGIPGEILEAGAGVLRIACGKDSLRLLELQPPGKKPMSAADFLNGCKLTPGSILP